MSNIFQIMTFIYKPKELVKCVDNFNIISNNVKNSQYIKLCKLIFFCFSNFQGVTSERDWLSFDNRYLLQELQKMSESKRATLQTHERLVHERTMMQMKLKEFKSELNDRDEVIQDLTSTIESRRGEDDSINQTLLTDFEANERKVGELFQDNFDKSCNIIKLQSQLLAIKESFEKLRRSKEAVSRKNEQLASQVRDLTINYDFQRSKTQRLSWQVDANKTKLENVADTKKELLAVKFELSRLREEKECVAEKLETSERKNYELESECNMLRRDKSNVEVEKSKVTVFLMFFFISSVLFQRGNMLKMRKYKNTVRNRDCSRQIESLHVVVKLLTKL